MKPKNQSAAAVTAKATAKAPAQVVLSAAIQASIVSLASAEGKYVVAVSARDSQRVKLSENLREAFPKFESKDSVKEAAKPLFIAAYTAIDKNEKYALEALSKVLTLVWPGGASKDVTPKQRADALAQLKKGQALNLNAAIQQKLATRAAVIDKAGNVVAVEKVKPEKRGAHNKLAPLAQIKKLLSAVFDYYASCDPKVKAQLDEEVIGTAIAECATACNLDCSKLAAVIEP